MRRAFLLFGLCVACWSDRTQQPATIDNHSSPLASRDLSGAYWCTIEAEGFKYDPYPCVIRQVNGRFQLAKLGGSQRFTGNIRPTAHGFLFDGEFYCPWG